MLFFREAHVFLKICWIGLFGTKWVSFHLEKSKCRKYSFQKLTEFSQGNQVLDAPASNTDNILPRDTCVSSTQMKRPIWTNISLAQPLIYLTCKKYSLEKLTQFSQGNDLMDAPHCNIDAFLATYTCVSSILLNMPFWNKMSLYPPWKT
jgi:hypothetical protein